MFSSNYLLGTALILSIWIIGVLDEPPAAPAARKSSIPENDSGVSVPVALSPVQYHTNSVAIGKDTVIHFPPVSNEPVSFHGM